MLHLLNLTILNLWQGNGILLMINQTPIMIQEMKLSITQKF